MESWVPLCALDFVSSHLIFVTTPCLECVHASVHEFMSTWLPYVWSTPMHSLIGILGAPCMAVCLCRSHLISVATPCLECVQVST